MIIQISCASIPHQCSTSFFRNCPHNKSFLSVIYSISVHLFLSSYGYVQVLLFQVFNGGEEDVPVPETGLSIITSDSGEQGANDSEITHISNLISQGQKEEVDNQHSVKQLNDLEENVSVVTDLEKKIQELEEENKSKELLETAIEVIKTSLSSLQEQERISSSKNEEVEALKSHVAHLQEEVSDKQEELSKSQERERKAAQDNSRLQARLSNAQTYGDHHASMLQKLRHEITTLQDRNKTLEKHNLQRDSSLKNTQVEQQVVRESHQKLQERICELEEKVIKVNEEKQKLKADYDEAVKALEAVDKVVSFESSVSSCIAYYFESCFQLFIIT